MRKAWTADDVLSLGRSYQAPCVLAAAVDLDIFSVLADSPLAAAEVGRRLGTDLRATTIILDALAALELVDKHGGSYALHEGVAELLTSGSPSSVLPMARHQANCQRRWVQLARVVQTGKPAERRPSIRGEVADKAAFIGAMHTACEPIADRLVNETLNNEATSV